MIKHRIVSIALIVAMVLPMTALAGCGQKSKNFIRNELPKQLEAKEQSNIDLLSEIHNDGLIDDKLYGALVDNIKSRINDIESDISSSNSGNASSFSDALVDWCNSNDQSKITTDIANNDSDQVSSAPLFNAGQVSPLILLYDNKDLEDRLNLHICVLNPDAVNNKTGDSLGSIIQKAVDSNDSQTLDTYFSDSGTTYMNSSTNTVICDSSGSQLVDSNNTATSGITIQNSTMSFESDNAPGHDLVITEDNSPVFALRVHELNADAINRIHDAIHENNSIYKLVNGKLYLVQYPAYCISQLKNKDNDNSSYECLFGQSNTEVNLYSGEIMKDSDAWGTGGSAVTTDKTDTYLDTSSFIATNNAGAAAAVGASGTSVSTAMIVLRDYLEATYSPGLVNSDNLVLYGRKIRVESFSGNKESDRMAEFYDKDNNVLPNTSPLMAYDFADATDANGLNHDPPYLETIGTKDDTIGSGPSQDSNSADPNASASPSPSTSPSSATLADYDRISELTPYYVASIDPTAQFPGQSLGSQDSDNSSKPLFYALAVKSSMFETALYDGWINVTDGTNSLSWWNGWLKSHNYKYTIDTSALDGYLKKHYVFELQKRGAMILDLKTINQIQKDYDAQDQVNNIKSFRTAFVVLGYAIICYSLILMTAWAVDTNVDLGLNLLEKLTFGHWIAIKDEDELPYADTEDRHYVTFNRMAGKCLIIAIVGVVLILVNVINIVIWMINIFGGIASQISKLFNGITQ